MVIDAGVCGARITADELNDPADLSPMDATGRMLTGDGVWYEDWLGDQWEHALADVDGAFVRIRDNEFDADGNRDKAVLEAREADTVSALRDAVEQTTSGARDFVIVFNGRLRFPGFSGESDAWLVQDGRIYPIDVKHSKALKDRKQKVTVPVATLDDPRFSCAPTRELDGVLKPEYDLQLVHYFYQVAYLAELFGAAVVPDEPWGAILPKPIAGEPVLIWRRLDDVRYKHPVEVDGRGRPRTCSAIELHAWHYRRWVELTEAAREFRDSGGMVPLPVRPELQSDCSSCRWRDVCKEVLTFQHDVTLVQGVNPTQATPLRAADVHSAPQLALLCEKTAAAVDLGLDVTAAMRTAADVPADVAVGQLLGLKPAQIASLERVGVTTAGDVTAFDPITARVEKIQRKKLVDLIDQSRAQLEQRVFTQRGVKASDLVVPGCGSTRLNGEPSLEVHYDLEALVGSHDSPNPMVCDHVYLHGALLEVNGRKLTSKAKYKAFYNADELSDDAERRVFASYWSWWKRLLRDAAKARAGQVVIYHYSAYEHTTLRKLVDRYEGARGIPSADEFDRLWTNYEHRYDLYEFVRTQMVLPTKSLSIKDVASEVGSFFWRADDPSGSNSIAWQRKVFDADTPDAERAALKRKVLEYNEDDVRATLALRERLHYLLRFGTHKVHCISDLDDKYARRRRYVRQAG